MYLDRTINTQEEHITPSRKTPGRVSNPGLSRCKATVLLNAAPCRSYAQVSVLTIHPGHSVPFAMLLADSVLT